MFHLQAARLPHPSASVCRQVHRRSVRWPAPYCSQNCCGVCHCNVRDRLPPSSTMIARCCDRSFECRSALLQQDLSSTRSRSRKQAPGFGQRPPTPRVHLLTTNTIPMAHQFVSGRSISRGTSSLLSSSSDIISGSCLAR